jgi:hypothetical protein
LAVTDAYADAAEYRARVTKTDTADDPTILVQLKAVSRYLDRKMGRFFTIDSAAVARVYDGSQSSKLFVDDIGDKTGIAVKVDMTGDGDFVDSGETLTENTHYIVGPRNAALGPEPEPYTYLELMPSNGLLTSWWNGYNLEGLVQVTARYGWPAIPPAVKELTVAITRQIRDVQESGVTGDLQAIDNVVETSRELSMRLVDLRKQYSRNREVFV